MYTYNISIESGKYYRFTFRAKATSPFTISSLLLHKTKSPYNSYSYPIKLSLEINTDWETYTIYYAASTTADDARITFYLGNVIPDGAIFYLDSLSLKEVDGNELLITDVANLIMDNKTDFGVKKWGLNTSAEYWTADQKSYWTTLNSQGDFYYDIGSKILKIYSTQNPAIYYNGDIKLVFRGFGFNFSGKSFITIDGLHLSMAGTYGAGIFGYNPHHITIINCDFSYIGGADQNMNGVDPVRNGNAIGVECGGHDINIEKNRIWEIYDAAISPQSYNDSTVYNIYVLNNIIWNSEYGIEYWQKPETTQAHNIYFDNNTIVDSGYGWSHNQRTDTKNGRCLMVFINTALQSNITFRNNICFNATEGLIRASRNNDLAPITMANNYYSNNFDQFAYITYYPKYVTDKTFFLNELSTWQAITGKDQNSKIGYGAIFLDKFYLNFGLLENSLLIDAGTTSNTSADFFGNPIYGTRDIGAIEYQPPYIMGINKVSNISIRIYGDGKYRNLSSRSISPIDFAVIPQSSDTKQWLDITNLSWGDSKQWIESSDNLIGTTHHVIGDLQANKSYQVLVDNVLGDGIAGCNDGVCISDSSGKINFIYTGEYTNRIFTVE